MIWKQPKCPSTEEWIQKMCRNTMEYQFSSVQSLSRVQLFATPWIAARQASLSITISQSSLKLTSIESVMPSSHLILCYPLFLLLPIPPSIRVFSNESTLHMRWPKYWSFSFSIIPSKEYYSAIKMNKTVQLAEMCTDVCLMDLYKYIWVKVCMFHTGLKPFLSDHCLSCG